MRFTFPKLDAMEPERRSRYLFGGLKLIALLIISAALTAAKCGGGGCQGCIPCPETKKVKVILQYQGQPITDLKPGSSMRVGVYNGNGTITYLGGGLMTFGSNGVGTVDLTKPIPRDALIDADGNVRNPPDATFAAWDDKLCSINKCSPVLNWRYILLYPPAVDYDFATCSLVFKFNTQRICTVCP